ncbi:MAG: hypothetical protein OER90_16485 [Gemmatimonadota bacterium]|nr:hypothetical protein [Gemmatimonadota bacterium]
MYLRRRRARLFGLTVGLPALTAIILVSHVIPEATSFVVPVGVVGLLIALGLGLSFRKPPIDDAELLRRYSVLLRVHRDLAGLARRFDADDWRRIGELWEAGLLRFLRRRYDCGKYETAHLLRQWGEHVSDCIAVPPRFTADGEVALDDHECRLFDTWAAETGLTPQ